MNHPAPRELLSGTLYALAAGLMWGVVFVAPLLLPEYPAALLTCARYLAFGLIALPLALLDRARLAQLDRADWWLALQLAAVGNLLYYLCLAAAIQRAGAPLPTMIIGTLPVVIAIAANLRSSPSVQRRDGRLPWARLWPSLVLIGGGILLVNQAELGAGVGAGHAADGSRLTGVLLALAAVVCWTWYPLRNADWLRAHPERSATTWATAQGLATLPLALAGSALFWAWSALSGDPAGMLRPLGNVVLPIGPRPAQFLALMFAIALLASWLGTLCWNKASQRLPPALAGQMIVFETLAALGYAFVLRGRAPAALALVGVALLVAGVLWAVRVKPQPEMLDAHPN